MSLKLHDSLTRTTRPFTPLTPGKAGMYVCGVTPYDDSHIGHARVYVVFDVLYRLLRRQYGESNVTYVRNFTDVDDKIIARANEVGADAKTYAAPFMQSFHDDMAALGNLSPTVEPKVTTHMPEIIDFVQQLVAGGMAYEADGDVYYNLAKLPQTACGYHYGGLSGKKTDELVHGARVAADESGRKQNPGDFALWKAAKPGEPAWESPWGPGRPGWHIECSAMSLKHLGPVFDIHGGGEDLQFPHHENEIAQNCGLFAHEYTNQVMANFWLHNAFITVGGQKMSKSLGNFTIIKDVLKTYSGEVIRLWLLQTHYRKPVDFSADALDAANARLKRWNRLADVAPGVLPQSVLDALQDDLNTPRVLAAIDALESPAEQRAALDLLGLSLKADSMEISQTAEGVLAERAAARTAKNWAESDRLRDVLKTEHGIIVEDGPNGTTWRRA